jgi:VCBS repeat-containing protein
VTSPLKSSNFALNADGSFTYTARPGTTGDDQFFYDAFDGELYSDPARVVIHINTPAVAVDDKYDTYVGNPNPVTGNVLTNDIDHDITNNQPDTLHAILVGSDPSKGSVTLNDNGTFTFTPSASFTSGTTTFTYKVNDGWEDGNVATVTIYMDRLPVANNDTYNVRAGNTLEIFSPGLLANDTDADLPQPPNPLFFQYLNVSAITQQPAHGTLTWNANGYFQYTPNANFNGGVDTFHYRINDGLFNGSEGTVTINVQGIPIARDDAYVTFNRSLNVPSGNGVLVNDSSPNANLPLARLVTTTGNGQLTLNPDGSFQYLANAGFTGIDHFTYVATVPDPLHPGQTLDSTPATVSITVYANSSPPTARDDTYATPVNTSLDIAAPGLLLNDSDPNNLPLSAFLVSAPRNGTLTLNYDGSFSYVPQAGFQGVDSYTYQASDGQNFSNVATVTITVGNPITMNNPLRRIIEGQDVGGTVKVFAGETGQALFSIQPYGATFAGGIRVAVGDLNGDGVPDIITAPGPTTGAAQRVRAFDGVTGAPLNGSLGTGIFPFGSTYKGGIQVAVGDVNGDGTPDIVVSADSVSASPQVHVINGLTGTNFPNWLGGFSPFTGTSFGGVRVAVGDVNGDGKADIITSPGAGAPTVKVYNAAAATLSTGLIRSFSAYTTNVSGGVFVAAGDLDGDGRAEIVTGAATNPNGQVRIFNGTTGTVLRSLTLTGPGLSGPARVALGDINGDGRLDLVVGQANAGGSKARVYDAVTLSEMFAGLSLFTYGGGYNQGLFVASLSNPSGAIT